jgi:hypothetical protein
MSRVYEVFVLHQVLPAPPGWRAVYRADDGTYWEDPVPLFALVTRRSYRVEERGNPLGERLSTPEEEEETREVVALQYYTDEGFDVVDKIDNFVRLLPPDLPLAEWEAS